MRRGVDPRLTQWRREVEEYNRKKNRKLVCRQTNDGLWMCRLPEHQNMRTMGYGFTIEAAYKDAVHNREQLEAWFDKVLNDTIDSGKPLPKPTLIQSVKRRICRLFRAKNT